MDQSPGAAQGIAKELGMGRLSRELDASLRR
jgi:hypothetical protein